MNSIDIQDSIEKLWQIFSAPRPENENSRFVLVTELNTPIGIITDGDIRKFVAQNNQVPKKIAEIVNRNYVVVDFSENKTIVASRILEAFRDSKIENISFLQQVLVKKNAHIFELYDVSSFEVELNSLSTNYIIFGMGYVGLTLAAVLNKKGFNVTGVENDSKKLSLLKSGHIYVSEPQLENYLRSNKAVNYVSNIHELTLGRNSRNVYIIAVNTPLHNYEMDLSSIKLVIKDVGSTLKRGDLVLFRTTLNVGGSRNLILELETISGLKCGSDFFSGFVPERTVEGAAIAELESLPQIVSGFSNSCKDRISAEVAKWAPSIIMASNLESAELIKLANNAYRDFSFAFANELALISMGFDVDVNEVIELANRGYPRSQIAKPSPGVGGPCLSKDSLILVNSVKDKSAEFSSKSAIVRARKLNENMPQIYVNKLLRDADSLQLDVKRVHLVGLAFKGIPNTNDIRNSPSVEMYNCLIKKEIEVSVWDSCLTTDELNHFPGGTKLDLKNVDVILIGNNNPDNVRYLKKILPQVKPRLIGDPWNLINFADLDIKDFEFALSISKLSQKPEKLGKL